jgi:cell division control protein CDC15
VALKVMRISDEELLLVARAEFDLLRSIEHPNIIRVLDFCTFPQGVVLVMDFFDGQSLKALMHDRRPCGLTETTSRGLFTALMRAVDHLHQNGIIHRDVKADNVLVDAQMIDLRLVDFNTAQRVASGALTMTGTADYMPPEVLFGEAHSEGSDIWACGLCLHLMIVGTLPFVRSLCSSHAEFGRVVLARRCARPKLSGRHWETISKQCREVVHRCLAVSQEERPRACEVLTSDWLCELPAASWEVPFQNHPTEQQ